MALFKAGDRVEAIVDMPDDNPHIRIGDLGTVVDHRTVVMVRWDNYVSGHNCCGLCEDGHGWNVRKTQVRLYEEEGMIDILDDSFMKIIGGSA